MASSSKNYFNFFGSPSNKAPKEKDLISQLEEKNYENTGVDVSLTLTPPFPEPKRCYACGRTKTPLWRSGRDGPKTACNACGIRYRKEEQKLNTALTIAPPTAVPPCNARRL